MIKLDNVNMLIKQLGGDEIELQLYEFIKIEVLDMLKWACLRDDFPEDANRMIEYLIAIKAILNKISIDELSYSKDSFEESERSPKSVTIENTKVDFEDNNEVEIKNSKLNSYKNNLNRIFDERLKIFCNRYRCLKC